MSDDYLLYDPAAFGALEIKEDTRDSEILRLRAENEKLRAALKPFADFSERFSQIFDDNDQVFGFRLGDLRAAAAALKDSNDV